MADVCHFNGCSNAVLAGSIKCAFHKHREICTGAIDCRNQVYARRRCVKHGGKVKCCHVDCSANARVGCLCTRHGGNPRKKLCTHPGCEKVAHAHDKCVGHGGGHRCKADNCKKHARRRGYCQRHGRDIMPQLFPPLSTAPRAMKVVAKRSTPSETTTSLRKQEDDDAIDAETAQDPYAILI
ncbi:hypothetical protein LEN26_017094 [Aphanomyces euteiches]|nr:hypothetical protein LEN26_017094 [Aphanomyces euteiches]